MSKRNLLIRVAVIVILTVMLVPTFMVRVNNESRNKDVVFALNYNNAHMVLSAEEFEETLDENKKIGMNTLLIGEESLNSLISAGYVTGIRYNVLCHKYDDESEEIIKLFEGNRKIHNDSYVLITKRPEVKEYLNKWITAKYSSGEYIKKVSALDADVYILYEGISDAWKVTMGFDEKKIEYANSKGFNIALSMMVGAYSNTGYIEYISQIVDQYNVKYINLKEGYKDQSKEAFAEKNYNGLCQLIKEKGLYLVVTETPTQLSNQKPIGYDELIKSAEGRVIRSYETVDFFVTNTGTTVIDKRYYQVLNSVVDRNLRFVTVNQLTNGTDSFGERSRKTNAATAQVMRKLEEMGYNTQSYTMVYDYAVDRRYVSALGMVLMIVMVLSIIEWLREKITGRLVVVASAGMIFSVLFSYKAPESLILLYPTLFAAIAPCFAITATFMFVKHYKDKISWFLLTVFSVIVALGILLWGGMVQSVLLSGFDYYINSLIFRGIKISLILPILYSIAAYGLIFGEKQENYIKKMITILNAQIRVYWMLAFGAAAAVAGIYLIRSGNVSEISATENLLRNTITNLMTERPRTKEFLVGWPCLVLFINYVKNSNIKLLKWAFAVGSSILFASVINSFCHVFTGAEIIYTRVINGVVIGAFVCVGALVVNAVIVKVTKSLMKKGRENG